MLKISNNKPCIESKSKFDFLQAVKWKMSEFLYFHGLIMTASKHNVPSSSICIAIKKGTKSAGYYWKYINK